MPYDYFYNGEAEQYLHYTLPKLFFKDMDGSPHIFFQAVFLS